MKKIAFVFAIGLIMVSSVANAQEEPHLDVIDTTVINTKIEQLETKKAKLVEFQSRTEQIEAKGNYTPGFEPTKRKDLTPQIEIINRQLEQLKKQRDLLDQSQSLSESDESESTFSG